MDLRVSCVWQSVQQTALGPPGATEGQLRALPALLEPHRLASGHPQTPLRHLSRPGPGAPSGRLVSNPARLPRARLATSCLSALSVL